tara:strand:- start:3421 stop:3606 length:186 start_codon:yes stop_codon:yes gene_type:complete
LDYYEVGLFYEPENSEEMAKGMLKMASNPDMLKEMGLNARKYVTKNFNRNTIAASFKKVLQ